MTGYATYTLFSPYKMGDNYYKKTTPANLIGYLWASGNRISLHSSLCLLDSLFRSTPSLFPLCFWNHYSVLGCIHWGVCLCSQTRCSWMAGNGLMVQMLRCWCWMGPEGFSKRSSVWAPILETMCCWAPQTLGHQWKLIDTWVTLVRNQV